VDDALVTRPAVSSAITNGNFSSATGWTNGSTDGATATVVNGFLRLEAIGRGGLALFKQQVTTATPGVEHALRIVVNRGPVTFRCGSTDGGDEYIGETELKTGVHSLAFTPSGSYWVQLQSDHRQEILVDSINVEAAGVLSIPTPWSVDDLPYIRTAQSADVIFVACRGKQQHRIERRGVRGEGRSWSIVKYASNNGPFTPGRTARVRLRPDVLEGNGNLIASGPFFRPEHVGALFRLTHTGQLILQGLSGNGRATDPIEVTGINNMDDPDTVDQFDDRQWSWAVSGTWAGTLGVQRSFDGPDFGYKLYRNKSDSTAIGFNTNDTGNNTDKDSNARTWYRLGFEEGAYTSGTAVVNIVYKGGGGSGICRITSVTTPTSATMEVLSPFKAVTFTDDWQEGMWSGVRGFPSSVALYEGRLWWAGADNFWGSVSDDYENFDETIEGDAGPISRVLSTDGVNDTQWMLSLQRLVLGTEGTETTARSSSFDEPLTPTNTTLKDTSTIGSAPIAAVRIDGRGIFVDRSGRSLFEIAINAESADYASTELTELCKELFNGNVAGMAVQRRPDTRIWIWFDDGRVVCLVYELTERIAAFIPIATAGAVESISVLPAQAQDKVYFVVRRTINGNTVRYLERMAMDREARPGTVCKVLDSCVTFTNSPASTTVNVGSHLIGETVRVWADGAPITEQVSSGGSEFTEPMEFVVDGSGNITVPQPVTTGVVGLPYSWRYRSARLAYGAAGGTAMLKEKRVSEVGLIMTDFVRSGVKYGSEFDNTYHPLRPLPVLRDRQTAPEIVIGDVHDEEPFVLDGAWSLDARVCLEGQSPFPASLLGMTLAVTTNG